MAKPNLDFIKSSFSDTTFANTKVNAIFIVNSQGEALYKKGLDFVTGKPWHLPELLEQAVRKGGILIDPSKNNHSGLFWTSEGIYIVSAFDVLNSNEEGPRRGTLIMARLLDQPLKDKIAKILGTKISVEGMREDEISSISRTLTKNHKEVIPLNDSQVAGFALINAIDNDTELVLSTVADRKIFEQGKSSLKFLYWSLGLIALFLALFSWLLDKLVLTRLAHLSLNVKRIGESATMSGRVQELKG